MFHPTSHTWQERKTAARVFQTVGGYFGIDSPSLPHEIGSTGESILNVDIEWRDQVVALIPALRAFAWSISRNGSDATIWCRTP
ncbi:MAG: hypothetical protein WDM85_00765 [Caulobacteraceae bacterium]